MNIQVNQMVKPIQSDTTAQPPTIRPRTEISETAQSKKKITEEQAPDNEQFDQRLMEMALKQANEAMSKFDRHIERQVHDVTNTVMYTLKDNITNEVIAEFPPRKIQDMVAKMWEMAGLFVDKEA